MSIKGKVALITGSADGIGKGIALLFAKEGARLMLCDINPVTLQQTEKEIKDLGAEVTSMVYDGRSLKDIDSVFDKLFETYGGIDILVNNTGIAGAVKPIVEILPEEWDETLEVNLRGTFYCIKKAAPYMMSKKSGKIICLSSCSGKKSLRNRSPYCASKIAILGLVRCAADELGEYEINVNAICPGLMEGTRMDTVLEGQSKALGISKEEAKAIMVDAGMLKRPIPPDDVAQMALFLADDEKSRSITGQDFNVNCGTIVY